MRPFCWACHRSQSTCYCQRVKPFETSVQFVILLHPKEARKRIGTGRLVGKFISNSAVIQGNGWELDIHPQLLSIAQDPGKKHFVLFPGPKSFNISEKKGLMDISGDDANPSSPQAKTVIYVIDGTWPQARKMIRTSRFLQSLPQICFTPKRRSNYRIREQPKDLCLSTVEAVHTMIELLSESAMFPPPAQRAHDEMLKVFDWMVDRQIEFESETNIKQPALPE